MHLRVIISEYIKYLFPSETNPTQRDSVSLENIRRVISCSVCTLLELTNFPAGWKRRKERSASQTVTRGELTTDLAQLSPEGPFRARYPVSVAVLRYV